MSNAIGDSLSDLGCSDHEQHAEYKQEDEADTEHSKLSNDDEPRWVMGPISKTVQHRVESFRQRLMRLDELTQPGQGDAANSFRERNMKYGTAQLKVPAVVKPQIDTTAETTPPTSFGENMQNHDTMCGQRQMPAVTSRPGSSQMGLGSQKPQ